jgi:hypothetical protein
MKIIFLPIILLTLVSIASPVLAQSSTTIDFTLHTGWNLVYGLKTPLQIIGAGDNQSTPTSQEELRAAIELIYSYNPLSDNYDLLYTKEGSRSTQEYKSFIPPEEVPQSVTWVYSERVVRIKYQAPAYPSLAVRNIYKGWNFVPVSSEMTGKSITDLKGNCTFEKVYTYAEENGKTDWLNLSSVLGDKRLLQEASASGLQLAIEVRDDCRMSSK